MKNIKILILILGLGLSGAALAKEKKAKKKAEREEEPAGPSGNGGSSDKRAHSHFWVAGGGGGVMGGVTGGTLEGAYVLSSLLQVGGGFAAGSEDLNAGSTGNTSDITITNDKIGAKLFFAKARFFVGNSFNVASVLSYRIISATADIKTTDGANEVDMEVKSSSITVGLTIGNHWAFDNGLTIGADWIGYHYPVSSSAKTATTTKGALSQAETSFADDTQKLGEDLGKIAHTQVLVGTLGFLF